MRGDFSRYRFDPAKHYTAVLEQQGRVQLDADANEQRSIEAHRLVTETVDVIGNTGAPIHAAGFAISLRSDNNSLLIGPGRYYVNGLLCEMAAQTDYSQQTFLIGPQPGIDMMLADLRAGRASAIQVWLEAWQRMVTPIDDPCIKDPALGEADTTVRVQTVWRVVAEEVAPVTTGQAGVAQAVQGLSQSIAAYQAATHSTALISVETQAAALSKEIEAGTISNVRLASSLTALHAAASATVSRLRQLPAGTGSQLAAAVNAIAQTNTSALQQDCCAAMSLSPVQLMAGEMTAGTGDASSLGPCLPSPQAAYRGLENQLYRIEVHQGGALGAATFKWSRDNGSVLTRITNVSGKVLTVDSLGPDANLGFAPLQWVEISDDSDEFGPTPNQPGQLHQIQTVDFAHNQITLTETAPAVDTENGHAKLRRWDQTDANATDAGVPMAAPGDWNSLENGIQVQFSDARPFQSGDFWLVPARTATGEVEWPPCDSDGASFQLARNTTVYRAPLACIDWKPNAGGFVPYDCRDTFYPLTELSPPPTAAALHVTAINWANDDVQTLDQLFADGLNVTLDGAPVTIDPARYIVTLEYPISIDQFSNAAAAFVPSVASGLLRSGVIVDGAVSVNGNTITWSLPRNLYFYLAQVLESFDGFANQQLYIRARVLLKGRMIWGTGTGAMPFLDGQCFGVAAIRSDGQTPRTDLIMPSGAAAKASDFESWFYLAPLPRVASLAAAPPAVAWVPAPGIGIGIITRLELVDAANPTVLAVPVLNLSLNYNAIADTQVMITVTGGTPGIVTVQSPVTIPRGAVSPAQAIPLSVRNTGQDTTETYTLTAAVVLSSGVQFSLQTNFSVTGHTVLGRPPPIIGGPIAPIQPLPTVGGGGVSSPSSGVR